jgi:hypothetical protein
MLSKLLKRSFFLPKDWSWFQIGLDFIRSVSRTAQGGEALLKRFRK